MKTSGQSFLPSNKVLNEIKRHANDSTLIPLQSVSAHLEEAVVSVWDEEVANPVDALLPKLGALARAQTHPHPRANMRART
eukprot:2111991-Pleurochrysis_carterae.AAC.1